MMKNRKAKFSESPMKIRARFARSVRAGERAQIIKALENISARGDEEHRRMARFVLESPVLIRVEKSADASGGAGIYDAEGANAAMRKGEVPLHEAARFVHLIVARRTIQNGTVDLEGTLAHEMQHVENDARTIHTLSRRSSETLFNPTQYENELAAHTTAARYLALRGGDYARMGIELGLVKRAGRGAFEVDVDGIRRRIENCYVIKDTDAPLCFNAQGVRTTEAAALEEQIESRKRRSEQ
jgi:hypothetical protein